MVTKCNQHKWTNSIINITSLLNQETALYTAVRYCSNKYILEAIDQSNNDNMNYSYNEERNTAIYLLIKYNTD